MIQYVIVCIGAGLGGGLRHFVNVTTARLWGVDFPYGTLTVNVLGSLLVGLLAGYFAFKVEAPQHWRLFFITGILGGFTTFSAFSLEVALMIERASFPSAIGYIACSVAVTVLSVFLGLFIMRAAI